MTVAQKELIVHLFRGGKIEVKNIQSTMKLMRLTLETDKGGNHSMTYGDFLSNATVFQSETDKEIAALKEKLSEQNEIIQELKATQYSPGKTRMTIGHELVVIIQDMVRGGKKLDDIDGKYAMSRQSASRIIAGTHSYSTDDYKQWLLDNG